MKAYSLWYRVGAKSFHLPPLHSLPIYLYFPSSFSLISPLPSSSLPFPSIFPSP